MALGTSESNVGMSGENNPNRKPTKRRKKGKLEDGEGRLRGRFERQELGKDEEPPSYQTIYSQAEIAAHEEQKQRKLKEYLGSSYNMYSQVGGEFEKQRKSGAVGLADPEFTDRVMAFGHEGVELYYKDIKGEFDEWRERRRLRTRMTQQAQTNLRRRTGGYSSYAPKLRSPLGVG